MKIKLYNKGKRTITYGHDLHFKPDSAIAFEQDMADNLRKMYPGEVLSLEDVKDQFEKEPTIPVSQAEKERDAAIAAAVEKAVAEALAKRDAPVIPEAPAEKTDEEILAELEKEETEAKSKKK